MSSELLSSFCNSCGRDTAHEVLCERAKALDVGDGAVNETKQLALRCGGCGEWSVREEVRSFAPYEYGGENEGILQTINFKPPRRWRRLPSWIDDLDSTNPDLKGLLEEIYSAANDEQVRLLSMGVRTALDYVMNQIVGDLGTFEEKLKAMVAQGHLTTTQKEMLETVIDAGSASTHRSYKPPKPLLEQMVTVMENVICEHYITKPYLKTARNLIPPRPPRTSPSSRS